MGPPWLTPTHPHHGGSHGGMGTRRGATADQYNATAATTLLHVGPTAPRDKGGKVCKLKSPLQDQASQTDTAPPAPPVRREVGQRPHPLATGTRCLQETTAHAQ